MKKDVLLEDFNSRKFTQLSEIKGGGVPWYIKLWYGETSKCTDYNHGNCSTQTTSDYGQSNTETSSDVIQ